MTDHPSPKGERAMTPDLREAVTRLRDELARSASIAASVGATPSRTMVNDSDLKLVLSALSVPEGWVAVPREVVEPFARAADWEERCIDPDYGIARVRPLKDSRRVAVTLGECRAVRAALSAIPSPGGEGSSRPWPIDGAGNLGSAVASGDDGDAPASGVAE